MSKTKTYRIFDDPDHDQGATLVVTSNRNIREVCQVLCEHEPYSLDERIHYAKIGEIHPDRVEEEEAIYKFTNRTTTDSELFARLAEALFYDAPELTDDSLGTDRIRIADPALSELLIRQEVWTALKDFFLSFGATLYERNPLFNGLPSGLIGEIIDRMYRPPQTEKPGSDSTPTPDTGAGK